MTSPESPNNNPVTEAEMMKEENTNVQVTEPVGKTGISLVSLMVEDLRHRKWMLVLSSVVQLLMGPFATIFILSRYHNWYNISDHEMLVRQALDSVDSLYRSYLGALAVAVALCGALIVGVGGFRHLFSKSMTDMMNSVPVKRGKQFAVIYLNGFLMWLVPFAVSGLIILIIIAARLGSYGVMSHAVTCSLQMLLGATITFVCVYNLAVLAAAISGTVFNSLVNLLCLGLDAIVAYFCMIVMAQNFFEHFWRPALDTLEVGWMSQLVSPVVYGFVMSSRMDRLGFYFDTPSTVVCLFLTLAVCVINFIVAYRMYVTRKSEAAENGTIGKVYKFVLRSVNSVLVGLYVAAFAKIIIGDTGYTGWCMVITALFVVLMFGILEIIQKKSFRSFFDHLGQMIGSVIAAELVLSAFMFDMINFDNHIVPENNIAEAYVRMEPDYSYWGDTGSGYVPIEGKPGYITWAEDRFITDHYGDVAIPTELAERILRADKLVYEQYAAGSGYTYFVVDPVTGLKTLSGGNDMYSGSEISGYVYFELDRKAGPPFYRSYRIADPELFIEISKLDEYRDTNYPLNCGLLGYPLAVELVDDYGNRVYSFSDEEMHQVMDVYFDEFRKNYDEDGLNALNGNIYKYQIICRYEMLYNEESSSTHFFYLYLQENDSKTVELIEKLTGLTIDEFANYNYDYYEDVYYTEPY